MDSDFSSSADSVEQSFDLAREGCTNIMLRLRGLEDDSPLPTDLIPRMNVVRVTLAECTALLQKLFILQATKLTPRAEKLAGVLATLVKEHYNSQWQNQVVKARLASQSDETPMSLHQKFAVARINNCLSELLEVVRGDEEASRLVRYCLGVQNLLIQLHCMTDGLALAENYLDYRSLFFREFHPRIRMFAPGFVSFMLTLLNRATANH
jgi:hypothetical protein